MSNTPESQGTVSKRAVEVVVALIFMGLAALVIWDSMRIGAGWASDGPESGYFPFWIGLLMFGASAATLILQLVAPRKDVGETFVERDAFVMVLKVLIPTIVFVVAVGFLGIYFAAALFIAFFMAWLGRYGVKLIVPIALGVPLFLFVLFEIWFLVPLPKGPLEAALGY